MRISEVLSSKPIKDVITVTPDATVRELVGLLAQHNVGALVVCDGDELAGIVSERDVVRRLQEDETVLDREVSSIMTSEVKTCAPDQRVTDLMQVMTTGRFRHMPVLEDGRLVGIVSIGDVVKHRMNELEFERDQLDSYVHTSQT
jgi:CBS domain-containing protein